MNFLKIFFISVIFISSNSLFAQEKEDNTKESYIFGIGADSELPSFIRYGNKISGFNSHTFFFEIGKRESKKNTKSFFIGINSTVSYMTPPDKLGSAYGIIFAGLPVIPISWFMQSKAQESELNLLSAIAGYSYHNNFFWIMGFGFTAACGPAYARIGNKASSNIDVTDFLRKQDEAYNALKGVDNEYGARINLKIKLTFTTEVRYSINLGYTHYIFINNNFNSIDFGLGLTAVF